MADLKLEAEQLETVQRPAVNIYQKESTFSRYIPGGYSPTRCLKLTGKPMMYAILSLAGCAIMFFGYDASVMSLVNTNEDYLTLMGAASGSDRDSAAIGGLVSLWFGGFAIGAICVGHYADRIGRLKTIELGCLWGILGAALQASAQNFTWMAFARIIGGIGCGHLNTVVPIWTSELADPHLRGAFVAVEFTLALTGSTMYSQTPPQQDHANIVVCIGWILLVAVPFYPESPRHLTKIEKHDDARQVLMQCRLDPADIKIEQEMLEIEDAIRLEASSTSHSFYSMLFTKDRLHTRRRVILGAGVQVMQKLTGIDFIATYAPEMFTLAGYGGDKPALLAGGNYISYTASLALAIYLADRFGRRKLMLAGSTMMGILAHEVVSKSAKGQTAEANRLGGGVAAVLYLYTFMYGSTWLTTCWVYPTEIFPLASRAKGVALATVAFSIAGGVINEIVPYLINAIGFWVFILFALINLAMLIPTYLFYIETANRHLEDLDLLFAGESHLSWRAEREFEALKGKYVEHVEEGVGTQQVREVGA
ncbi:related to transporter (major facilitator superfamily) [Phialocephala subalpina]|uniref:Related to transporter (Major facilitator superfamily) n=1 Tax=Phialocephala subalpina TaxID=576137 RepID=A0A1L7XLJ3_9HELO|nr:related to transporter (major facilitator superfamily) [Phialocephala subalpina]